jgi:hypothetical protein
MIESKSFAYPGCWILRIEFNSFIESQNSLAILASFSEINAAF